MTEFCDRALWLDHGELVMQGDTKSVLEAYLGQPDSLAASALANQQGA